MHGLQNDDVSHVFSGTENSCAEISSGRSFRSTMKICRMISVVSGPSGWSSVRCSTRSYFWGPVS